MLFLSFAVKLLEKDVYIYSLYFLPSHSSLTLFPLLSKRYSVFGFKSKLFWSAYKVKKQFTTLFPPPLSSTTQKKTLLVVFSCFLLGSTFTFLSNKHVWLFRGLLILCIIYQLSIIPDRDLICPLLCFFKIIISQ